MAILWFVALSNGLTLLMLLLIEWLTDWFTFVFVNDYFFYAAIAQWLLASFFMVSGKERHSLKNSPDISTKKAASMISKLPPVHSLSSLSDRRLSGHLLLSGLVSMVICFII
ncbi:hypothetical protein MACH09_35550 [Vibrio sp. MACH09]|uniref:hypothetical protein n=1 Tax=unclassified Vibrio TaxID=2614977 RepID=UPI0014936637|nr:MULTISPECIES: hypothetical protein [unclassified Vibrio]NOI64740.1 hypothetical protein [Vibrio sp. 99-8-1]GLO63047.1 hypothetical protein MACH09_35550 [Vibrio sp. MACH09]